MNTHKTALALPPGSTFTMDVPCALDSGVPEVIKIIFKTLDEDCIKYLWSNQGKIPPEEMLGSAIVDWDFRWPYNKWHLLKFIQRYPMAYLDICAAYGAALTGKQPVSSSSPTFH